MKDPLDISHEVSCTLNRGQAVVALESSALAHGLPSPLNIETALAMEQQIRDAGAMPATIGVIGGKIRVGLSTAEIETLGKGGAAKLGARDLPDACMTESSGGTTVSATARIAASVGIGVMATGGTGGIHRGNTNDISADLWEMTRTPIAIVCSGPKAVLDVPATAQWLESHSIPVYGCKTTRLPAFYAAQTDITIPGYDAIDRLAGTIKLGLGAMGMRTSIMVAVPVPESDAVDVSKEIEEAIKQAEQNQITGKQLTPWLLSKIAELTDGRSVRSNVALLKNNAQVAAELACALVNEERRRMGFYS